ncbi:MAG: serine hydroxymethyltransferase, partial [Bdellovibrionales bacterium]|nr:serine hydroxymethyltransferase [Bdellovibrionales bacterium]
MLVDSDPILAEMLDDEYLREEQGLELIASENYASRAVMEAQGSVLTNKYAEGYPGKRYYGGCVFADKVEQLAIDRLCELYGSEAANVQPHSGSQANMAVYLSLLQPGEKILGMSLSHGGHLTHGSPVNFSGKLFQASHYGLHEETDRLDYNMIRDLALKERPRVLVAGASAYSRVIDFEAMGAIAREIGADLVVDMAHISGLIAAGLHPSPVPYASYVTSTTHKTLRGPRGGIILCSKDRLKAVNSWIFPGIQGGPLMHIIAAKAVAFGEALKPEFKTYQNQVILNARALAESLIDFGFHIVTGGTDNHLMLVDLARSSIGKGEITGKDAEAWLDLAGLTVNKNTVPQEKRSPFITSGIRLGTPALTTRGMSETEMKVIAGWIREVLESNGNAQKVSLVKNKVQELCQHFPVYSDD